MRIIKFILNINYLKSNIFFNAHLGKSILACLSGTLTVFGFAPFSFTFIPFFTLVVLQFCLNQTNPRTGFWRGWLFGLGLFGVGVAWIRISLHQFGNLPNWLANLLMILLVAALALYYGLIGWLSQKLGKNNENLTALCIFPAAYVISEWLRSWFLTGFPWLTLGYTQVSGPLQGFAPVFGVLGLSLLITWTAGVLWWMLLNPRRRWLSASLILSTFVLLNLGLKQIQWTNPVDSSIRVAMIQANIPQELKWSPDSTDSIIQKYLDLTQQYSAADLIVWPETAVPDFLHQVRHVLIEPLAQWAREQKSEIVLGIPILDNFNNKYYNGLLSIGIQEDLYTKRHLVPFGEFFPLKILLQPLAELFAIPLSDFSPGNSKKPILNLGKYQAGVSICYEDAFPLETRAALPTAHFLLNVSNDAWFGDSFAPHQHLEIAQMRALETGRDLIRVTNTGISALVNERGQITATLPAFTAGGTIGAIQPRSGTTPFVLWGQTPVIILNLILLLFNNNLFSLIKFKN